MRFTTPLLIVSTLALAYGPLRPYFPANSHAATTVALTAADGTSNPAPDTSRHPLKLVFMGSSVPEGTGATNHHGYVADYFNVLARRQKAGVGLPWQTANVSIPGDNTPRVLARYDRDLLPQRATYVVFALALGNEGIKEGGPPIFEQFRANLLRLVAQARADGMVPVLTNGYTRNDYGPAQYDFTRRMNALINGWNVPSINLLGAIDDGQGRWTTGYWFDGLHPNDRGHAEMAHAIVPSLFDALHAGKPLPRRRPSRGLTLGPAALRLVPEDVVHPFTTIIDFKTTRPGQLLAIRDSAGLTTGTLRVEPNGTVSYRSAKGGRMTGHTPAADNRWHQLALTHYYARGATFLYLDSTQVGTLPERLRPTRLDLGGPAAPAHAQYRNWLFYRSGMNAGEIRAVAADSLLQSSLELYAPLAAPNSLANLAQSLNTLTLVQASGSSKQRQTPVLSSPAKRRGSRVK